MVPKFFISSTIYDFKDLRSSIKYWLEEMDINVQLSEYNDFEKDLTKNSYEACLKNIDKCDYFILLIGSRVGGYYDLNKKISITQKEYRYAYELAKKGCIKLLIFVRKEIWDIKNDREELEKYLIDNYKNFKEINNEELKNLHLHKSNFINDADFIFNFIDEVGRKSEMINAIKGKDNFPVQNWIHQFTSFKDIIDVIKNELNINKNIDYYIHESNVIKEIGENLTNLYIKSKENNSLMPLYLFASDAKDQIDGKYDGVSRFTGKALKRLTLFSSMASNSGMKMSTKFIEQAIFSGSFFNYDVNADSYKATSIHKSLIKLCDQIDKLKQIESDFQKIPNRYSYFNGSANWDDDQIFEKNNMDSIIIFLLIMHDTHINILRLSNFILSNLESRDKKTKEIPSLLPASPLKDEAETIKKEKVTVEKALNALFSNNIYNNSRDSV